MHRRLSNRTILRFRKETVRTNPCSFFPLFGRFRYNEKNCVRPGSADLDAPHRSALGNSVCPVNPTFSSVERGVFDASSSVDRGCGRDYFGRLDRVRRGRASDQHRRKFEQLERQFEHQFEQQFEFGRTGLYRGGFRSHRWRLRRMPRYELRCRARCMCRGRNRLSRNRLYRLCHGRSGGVQHGQPTVCHGPLRVCHDKLQRCMLPPASTSAHSGVRHGCVDRRQGSFRRRMRHGPGHLQSRDKRAV